MSIEEAIIPIIRYLPQNNILALQSKLSNEFNVIINIYKNKKEAELEDVIEKGLLIIFEEWKKELQTFLLPYIVS